MEAVISQNIGQETTGKDKNLSIGIVHRARNVYGAQIGLLLWGPGNRFWNPSVGYQRVKDKTEVKPLGTLERIVKGLLKGF